MMKHSADVLVIGGGISGAFAAIESRDAGASVILVDKGYFGRSGCSSLASGVQQVFVPEEDNLDDWVAAWGGSLVNLRLARKAILESQKIYQLMDSWGVKWVKNRGRLVRISSGGGGSKALKQAMFAGGGPQMMMAMRSAAMEKGVAVINRVMITDLLTSPRSSDVGPRVTGAIGFDTRTGAVHVFHAKAVVVCTGPYRFPNASRTGLGFRGMPLDAAPSGIAMMLRAGAVLGKLEFGGYAPSPYHSHSAPGLELIGGLGGAFVDESGVDILADSPIVGDAGIQARRSTISLAIARRQAKGEGPAYLDCRHFSEEEFRLLQQVIPIVVGNMERCGYDPSGALLPYVSTLPCTAGGSGGGAAIREDGATTALGLFAAGNCSDGAYMTMGQQLVGCAVLGRWSGQGAAKFAKSSKDWVEPDDRIARERLEARIKSMDADATDYASTHAKVQSVLTATLGYELAQERFDAALERLAKLDRDVATMKAKDVHELVKVIGLQSFCEVLNVVLRVMMRRKESRGNVIRTDAPHTDNVNWLSYTRARRAADGSLEMWEEQRPETPDYMPVIRTRVLSAYFASQQQ